jgi:hypothetical protein
MHIIQQNWVRNCYYLRRINYIDKSLLHPGGNINESLD